MGDALDGWQGSQVAPHWHGLMFLAVPVGNTQYLHHHLAPLRAQQDQLFNRIPELEQLQASCLFFLSCANSQCNSQARMLPPEVIAP